MSEIDKLTVKKKEKTKPPLKEEVSLEERTEYLEKLRLIIRHINRVQEKGGKLQFLKLKFVRPISFINRATTCFFLETAK